jgi:hypothetical protein
MQLQQQLRLQQQLQQQQLEGGGDGFLMQCRMAPGPDLRPMVISPSTRQVIGRPMLVGQGVFDVDELQKQNRGATQRVPSSGSSATNQLLKQFQAELAQKQLQELQHQRQQQLLQAQAQRAADTLQVDLLHAQRQAVQSLQQPFLSGSSFVDAVANPTATAQVSGMQLLSGQSYTSGPWDEADASSALVGDWDASMPVHVPGFPSGQVSGHGWVQGAAACNCRSMPARCGGWCQFALHSPWHVSP